MSTETNAPASDVSVTRLLTGILNDAQDLALQHLALLRSELMESLRETRNAMVMLGIGTMLLQVGIIFFGHMCVVVLHRLIPSLSDWGTYAIVAGAFVIFGALPLMTALQRLKALDPSSEKGSDAEGRKFNG